MHILCIKLGVIYITNTALSQHSEQNDKYIAKES